MLPFFPGSLDCENLAQKIVTATHRFTKHVEVLKLWCAEQCIEESRGADTT